MNNSPNAAHIDAALTVRKGVQRQAQRADRARLCARDTKARETKETHQFPSSSETCASLPLPSWLKGRAMRRRRGRRCRRGEGQARAQDAAATESREGAQTETGPCTRDRMQVVRVDSRCVPRARWCPVVVLASVRAAPANKGRAQSAFCGPSHGSRGGRGGNSGDDTHAPRICSLSPALPLRSSPFLSCFLCVCCVRALALAPCPSLLPLRPQAADSPSFERTRQHTGKARNEAHGGDMAWTP
jgi:hypothetical protein